MSSFVNDVQCVHTTILYIYNNILNRIVACSSGWEHFGLIYIPCYVVCYSCYSFFFLFFCFKFHERSSNVCIIRRSFGSLVASFVGSYDFVFVLCIRCFFVCVSVFSGMDMYLYVNTNSHTRERMLELLFYFVFSLLFTSFSFWYTEPTIRMWMALLPCHLFTSNRRKT